MLALLFVGLAAARLCHSAIVWVEEAYPAAAAIQVLIKELWNASTPANSS